MKNDLIGKNRKKTIHERRGLSKQVNIHDLEKEQKVTAKVSLEKVKKLSKKKVLLLIPDYRPVTWIEVSRKNNTLAYAESWKQKQDIYKIK